MNKRLIYAEDAIDAIEQLVIPEDMCVFEILSHIELAIGTLPSAQPEFMKSSDLIRRQEAIEICNDAVNFWDGTSGVTGILSVRDEIAKLDSAQPEHLVMKSGNLVKGLVNDCISRQAALDAIERIFDRCEEIEAHLPEGDPDRTGYKMYPDYVTVWKYLHQVPSAHPERMTNRQWIDFLSAQFDISRTSAKEMLHGMMQWKKEDNFKKMFNGGKT